MSDLTTVNNTLKEQNELLKGNKTQDLENKREQDRKDAEMLKILSNLKPTVNINGKESKDSFLMSVLKGFGLIGAGAAGLAAGLLVGWLEFVATLIGKVGKFLFKLIDKIPRPKWLDDFLAAFKKEGKIGKIFTSIKNFFIGEASIFKRIGKLVDSAVDGLKSFTGGIFGKIKNFFMGETSIFKRIGKLVDSAVDGLKSFTGGLFGKIKNFFTSETSIFKRIGKLVDSAVDTVKGFTGGIFTKIGNFFTGEASIFKRIAKILDPIIDSVKGFSGGIFTKIGNFFTGETSIFKRMKAAIDPVIDIVKGMDGGIFSKISNFFGGETSIFKRMKTAIDPVIDIVKGMSGGIFTKIGNVFQSIKNFGATLMSPFKVIGDLLGMGGDAAKATKGGGGIVKTIMGFLSPMKSVFKAMAGLGRILGAPLTIIMGLIDAGFETKDAVEKSEGFFASILNGIFGAIGGFIDGAFLQVADLLKDGIAWIAGFFGFTEIEEELNSFSFSKIFNDMLDKVYEFVNKLFNNPMEMLRDISESVLGTKITNTLFGKKNADVTVEDFYGMTDIGKKEIDTDALSKRLGMMSVDEIRSLAGNFAGLEKGFENKDAVDKAFEMAMKSRMNAAASGTKPPVIIQQDNRQDNRQSMSQSTTLNAPANARQTEPTLAALK